MKIKSIEITNVKGIGNHNFQLDLIPNKPNVWLPLMGLGKVHLVLHLTHYGEIKLS